MNRRDFVSSLALAGATLATSERLRGATSDESPTVALIGCGWFGKVVLESLARSTPIRIISLCDPNTEALKTALDLSARFQRAAPATYADYRALLAAQAPEIAIISTPDHWHALPAIAAIEAGADLILEKPISRDVIEGEAIVAAARKHARVVQVNTQRRSTRCLAEARDKFIRSGRLGTIGLVETFSYLHGRSDQVVEPSTPPAHLDYDLWTGPAPLLPYRDLRWRNFIEYGNGQIGDLGVHMIDCVRWMLDLGWPQSISSTGGIYVDTAATATISDTQRSTFHYPHLDVSWEHRTWGAPPMPMRHWTDGWGARFIGSTGRLEITTLGYRFAPADGGPKEEFHLLSTSGNQENIDVDRFQGVFDEIQKAHVLDFLKARDARARPVADVEQGHISTACCALANLAQELGRPLAYDPATRTVTGDPEATRRLVRPYRGPWIHPGTSLA